MRELSHPLTVCVTKYTPVSSVVAEASGSVASALAYHCRLLPSASRLATVALPQKVCAEAVAGLVVLIVTVKLTSDVHATAFPLEA